VSRRPSARILATPLLAAALGLAAPSARAFGVLTHLAIVDATWDDTLVPAIRHRYPGVGENDLRRAHAAAYGGALVQDMGYYPGGSRELADLLHYVRSADFVRALLEEAHNPVEYAYALGALAHFLGDSEGHPLGVNRVVPMTFPKLAKKYGDVVTYGQDPKAHLRVEFGFDVVQVARGLYPPEAYREFIGFEVPVPLLTRAVQRTYGVQLTDYVPRPDRAVRSFRKFVATLFPKATRVAWAYKKDEIEKALPGATSVRFVYELSNAAFEKEWGTDYDRPGLCSRVGAFFLRFVPKIGPLRILIPKPPSPEGERVFEKSFTTVVDDYRARVGGNGPALANVNLDVGVATPRGSYSRADVARARWCARVGACESLVATDGTSR
jgi:hypothetical protein